VGGVSRTDLRGDLAKEVGEVGASRTPLSVENDEPDGAA
jgi:hypothetical protein